MTSVSEHVEGVRAYLDRDGGVWAVEVDDGAPHLVLAGSAPGLYPFGWVRDRFGPMTALVAEREDAAFARIERAVSVCDEFLHVTDEKNHSRDCLVCRVAGAIRSALVPRSRDAAGISREATP